MLQSVLLTLVIIGGGSRDGGVPQACRSKIRIGGPCYGGDRPSLIEFNHAAWDHLLRRFVDCEGQVCYQAWKKDCQAMAELTAYLDSLGAVNASAPQDTPESAFAFFINAYNALTVWGILQHYPTPSIQLHQRKRACFQIFEDLEVWIHDRYVSLNTIEHEILRPMKEPRIHFALVCAAKGCPRLMNEAYVADRLECQLTTNAIEFFSHPSHLEVCRMTGTVKLSPILDWYKEDFGASPSELLLTIAPWLPAAERNYVLCNPCSTVKYLGYNWGLNDRCPTPLVWFGRMPFAFYSSIEPIWKKLKPAKPATNDAASDAIVQVRAPAYPAQPLTPAPTPVLTNVSRPLLPSLLAPPAVTEPRLPNNVSGATISLELIPKPSPLTHTAADEHAAKPVPTRNVSLPLPPPPRALNPRVEELRLP